jgi:hypothetical protein
MNLTNAVAASNLRKMLRISESRAAALVEKIDIYDGQGRTTLANRGDGFVSSAEVSAFVAQVTALGGAGLTRTEQRSVSAFETMARVADAEVNRLPMAEWKNVGRRPDPLPMSKTAPVRSVPTTWDLVSTTGRLVQTINLRDLATRIAGGRSTLTLLDLANAVPYLDDRERYAAKHLADELFFKPVTGPVKTYEFTSAKGTKVDLVETGHVNGDLDVVTLSGRQPSPGWQRVRYSAYAVGEVSVKVPAGCVVMDANGTLFSRDRDGVVKLPAAGASALSIVRKRTNEVVDAFRLPLPDRALSRSVS